MGKKIKRRIKTALAIAISSIIVLPVVLHAATLQPSNTAALTQLLPSQLLTHAFPISPIVNTLLAAKQGIQKSKLKTVLGQFPQRFLGEMVAKNPVNEDVLIFGNDGMVTQLSAGSVDTVTVKMPEDVAFITVTNAEPLAAIQQYPDKSVHLTKAKLAPALMVKPVLSKNVSTANNTGWAIQIGSFKSKENAMRLTKVLRAKGYKAFARARKDKGLTSVYVGPEPKQNTASVLANHIKEDMQMSAIVLTYHATVEALV